jgi:hypothetical protein
VETIATVEAKPGGGLVAKFSQTHLSWWNLDDPGCRELTDWLNTSPLPAGNPPACQPCQQWPIGFTVKTGITEGNPNAGYWDSGSRFRIDVYNARTKAFFRTIWSDLVDGDVMTIYGNVDANFRIYLVAYDTRDNNKKYTSPEFDMCGSTSRVMNFTLPNPPAKPVIMLLDLMTGCTTSRGQQVTVIPTLNLYRIDVTNGAPTGDFRRWRWQYLGRINRGLGVTANLISGRKYHFAVFHGNLNWMSNTLGSDFANGLQIGSVNPSGAWVWDFAMKNDTWRLNKSFNLKPVFDNRNLQIYTLRLRPADFTPSTELCDRFVKYFR